MKIELNDKEYKALLEMLQVAEWVMYAFDEELKETDHTALKNKLMSYYKAMRADDYVEHGEDESYVETQQLEQKMFDQYITPYEVNSFWQMLSQQLAKRDVLEQMNPNGHSAQPTEDQSKQLDSLIEWYEKEFTAHGLSRLLILDDNHETLH